MARNLRFTPEGGALFEITTRTLQARYLLRPSQEVNEVFIGVFARAQRLYPIQVVGLVCLSNHYHFLAWTPDSEVLAQFMCYFNGNLAREIARLHRWRDRVWARRYQAILVSHEEAAQVARLKYLLSQSIKEGLVARAQDWPGVHCAEALLEGKPLEGYWFNRTQELASRRQGQTIDRYEHAEAEELHFTKLPCWAHLSDEQYQARIAELLEEVEAEGAIGRQEKSIVLRSRRLVRKAIVAVHPHFQPDQPKRIRSPRVHAARRAVRQQLKKAYEIFVAEYRLAAEKLRLGYLEPCFPAGSFPPGLPFVRPGPREEEYVSIS